MGKKVDGYLADAKSGRRNGQATKGDPSRTVAYKSPSGEATPAPGKVHGKDAEAGGNSRVHHLKTPSKPPSTCDKAKLALMPIGSGTPPFDQWTETVPDWSNRRNRAPEASFHNLPRISR